MFKLLIGAALVTNALATSTTAIPASSTVVPGSTAAATSTAVPATSTAVPGSTAAATSTAVPGSTSTAAASSTVVPGSTAAASSTVAATSDDGVTIDDSCVITAQSGGGILTVIAPVCSEDDTILGCYWDESANDTQIVQKSYSNDTNCTAFSEEFTANYSVFGNLFEQEWVECNCDTDAYHNAIDSFVSDSNSSDGCAFALESGAFTNVFDPLECIYDNGTYSHRHCDADSRIVTEYSGDNCTGEAAVVWVDFDYFGGAAFCTCNTTTELSNDTCSVAFEFSGVEVVMDPSHCNDFDNGTYSQMECNADTDLATIHQYNDSNCSGEAITYSVSIGALGNSSHCVCDDNGTNSANATDDCGVAMDIGGTEVTFGSSVCMSDDNNNFTQMECDANSVTIYAYVASDCSGNATMNVTFTFVEYATMSGMDAYCTCGDTDTSSAASTADPAPASTATDSSVVTTQSQTETDAPVATDNSGAANAFSQLAQALSFIVGVTTVIANLF